MYESLMVPDGGELERRLNKSIILKIWLEYEGV